MSVNLKSIIVLFLVLGSGAVVFQANSHLTFAILVATVLLWILASSKVIIFNVAYVALFVTLGIAVFLTMMLNGDASKYFSYLNFTARILIPFMIPLLISFQDFAKIYLRIIIFLALSSVVIFLLLLVDSNWYRAFPKTVGLTGLEYFNLFLFVVSDNGEISRNNSIFWEPGAFQGFLTLGLLFEIYLYKLKRIKNIVILCLASVTTVSTTGYIILLILLILLTTNFISSRPTKIKKSHLTLGLPLVLLCIAFMAPLFFESVFAKFGENNQSSFIRFSSTIVDLMVFVESAFYGLGLSNYSVKVPDIAYQLFYLEMGGSTNSITYHLAVYGVLFVIPLLWMYLKFCRLLTQDMMQAVFIFIIIMLTFATENFFSSLLWLTLGFYGAHAAIKRTHLKVSKF
ncbi:MAG: hypothetical protein CL855_08145 [Cryomorphaceae bacterium]|mgnify:CR=1 FL=1|nr:hypothetical protein [Cryomorphaceae bacterium]